MHRDSIVCIGLDSLSSILNTVTSLIIGIMDNITQVSKVAPGPLVLNVAVLINCNFA